MNHDELEQLADSRGQWIVLRLVWGDEDFDAVYGPWHGEDSLGHLDKISEFLAHWKAKHGAPTHYTLYIVQNPDEVEGLQPPEV